MRKLALMLSFPSELYEHLVGLSRIAQSNVHERDSCQRYVRSVRVLERGTKRDKRAAGVDVDRARAFLASNFQ